MTRGRFITLEGGEGAGKTTQIRLLADALIGWGKRVVLTREPGGSPGAEEIRGLLVSGETGRWGPVTEALLHTAARRDHLERTVWPALEAGHWVICDRFFDSTMAYQGYGLGLGRDLVAALQATALGDFRPDLTLILDLPVEDGLARAAARRGGEDRYERMDVAFHHRLRDGFLDIAAREPERCVVVDAGHPVETVEASILDTVTRRLGAS
ncbi:dTMP kinase [Azospirillum brasilense]|uniref:Thymidylate kinase n=1 Tax=Azospirillum brasilense TaxID=192 RepID=A0A0P0F6A7_AZOBR|nr:MULTISPECIES: dTMP kinase [Azospirillum]ALJ35334.1 thymidylate kinase [Azospirillum brasilense]MDW7555125.1 dTMP kinase [Azospirillum brasilense]MDW7594902.1 dTMP kinase [Azospirillum brasilense]MDW7629883.1 dTMP kinase [Azospirillum brasilense]MDX5954042.1 dTMP kinase [Azospirillum brasilense]